MSRFIHLQPNVFVVEQTSETAHEQTSLTLKQSLMQLQRQATLALLLITFMFEE